MRRVILASGSAARRELLSRLGIPFEAASPAGVDEDAAKRAERDPARLALRLSVEKAHSLRERYPDALIIGSDQVACVEVDGALRVLDKPGTAERAVEQLLLLSGRELRLLTGLALCDARSGATREALVDSRIRFRRLARAEAVEYVRRDRPLDCAGSFKLESLGPALMEACATEDPSAVIGLPTIALVRLLAEVGVAVLAASQDQDPQETTS